MASLADVALHSTDGKAYFQRLTRLLMCGGVKLLREKFDSIHSPADLPLKLSAPAVKKQLKTAKLTKPEWQCLYPAPGVYGQSTDFDITLIFRLFKTICSLTEPVTGWDNLPNSADHILEADLARIKYYRNSIYGHNHSMEITEAEFSRLWSEISDALLRIADSISNAKRDEWEQSINKFLRDPLTPEAERDVEELQLWYKNDMDVKDRMELMEKAIKQQTLQQREHNDYVCAQIRILVESFEQRRQQEETRREECTIPILPADEPGELQRSPQLPPQENNIWNVILSFKNAFDRLVQYLRNTLGVIVQSYNVGSLLLTVTCSSLEILQDLWQDYCSGHLNEVVQETLVTACVLEQLCLSEVKLKTIISKDEYQACKEFFMRNSRLLTESDTTTDQQLYADETGTREGSATNTKAEESNLRSTSKTGASQYPIPQSTGEFDELIHPRFRRTVVV